MDEENLSSEEKRAREELSERLIAEMVREMREEEARAAEQMPELVASLKDLPEGVRVSVYPGKASAYVAWNGEGRGVVFTVNGKDWCTGLVGIPNFDTLRDAVIALVLPHIRREIEQGR